MIKVYILYGLLFETIGFYLTKQWDAVRTAFGDIKDPPQICPAPNIFSSAHRMRIDT